MPPYSQNSNQPNYSQYTPDGYDKARLRKLMLIALGVLATIAIIVLVFQLTRPESQQSKYLKSATAAARKQIPDAEVRGVKVAGGFAMAIVSDPAADGQANSGNTTIFKVNKDGSMKQLAIGSDFSPIYLLELGMPLSTQAKLAGYSLSQAQQNLADTCGYSGGSSPGYIGFNSSFNPGGWQIDAATLDDLERALTNVVSNENAGLKNDRQIICVSATRENSNAITDKQIYISTFTLELKFINGSGAISAHKLTFATGFNNYRSYTLDGQKIQAN